MPPIDGNRPGLEAIGLDCRLQSGMQEWPKPAFVCCSGSYGATRTVHGVANDCLLSRTADTMRAVISCRGAKASGAGDLRGLCRPLRGRPAARDRARGYRDRLQAYGLE